MKKFESGPDRIDRADFHVNQSGLKADSLDGVEGEIGRDA